MATNEKISQIEEKIANRAKREAIVGLERASWAFTDVLFELNPRTNMNKILALVIHDAQWSAEANVHKDLGEVLQDLKKQLLGQVIELRRQYLIFQLLRAAGQLPDDFEKRE